jgi:hypothetical protein
VLDRLLEASEADAAGRQTRFGEGAQTLAFVGRRVAHDGQED